MASCFFTQSAKGPRARGYGLQVAQLAGVPGTVIRAARKHLAWLEQQSVAQATPQLDLFASPLESVDDTPAPVEPGVAADEHPAVLKLRGINPDDLRPRDAIDLLYELRWLALGQPDHD